MPEQKGPNKVITFFGGVRNGEIKIVSKEAIEIRSLDWIDEFPTYEKESLYREEPPGSGKFYLKEEKIVKEEDLEEDED